MLDNSWFDDYFAAMPVMAILRGMGPERTVTAATRAWDLGLTAVEIPIQRPADIEALRAVVAEAAVRGLIVGAGTVTSVERVALAAGAGARYTVAPGLDLQVAEASKQAGLPHLPGVATATEIHTATRSGLRWVKAFPAAALGPIWFKAMAGPFPDARFVATGGLSPADVPAFLDAGVRVAAVGSALLDPAQLTALSAVLPGGRKG